MWQVCDPCPELRIRYRKTHWPHLPVGFDREFWYPAGMDELREQKTYKIGQAARKIGVKPYVLRFWEGEFEEIQPIRTESGQRLYTVETLEVISEIKRLLYDEGLTIEGAKKKLGNRDRDAFLRDIQNELVAIRNLLGD